MDDRSTVVLERQESLGLVLPKAVAVVGCGGVGSWLAYFLALAGVKSLWLYDHDTVSASNLNRLPVPATCVGAFKTDSMAKTIEVMRPDCRVRPMKEWTPEGADRLNLADSVDWIAATTDTHANRVAIHKWALTHKLAYIEASAEGEFGGATGAPADWSTDLERNAGYASVPVWVGPCVTAGWLACAHILHNKSAEGSNFRLGWENGRPVWQSKLDEPTTLASPIIGAPKP